MQAQDPALSPFSIGLRCTAGRATDVRAAIDVGSIVRVHILRPTWHVVAAEDLRWLLALTSPKVESSFAARTRSLGLDGVMVDRAFALIVRELAGGASATRAEVARWFSVAGLATHGEQVRHLLVLAELRGLVCSGPTRGRTHTYALVDERIAPTPAVDRDESVRQLVVRFMVGHGPAAVGDLLRWTTLTKREITGALDDLGDALDTVTVDGTPLWFAPAAHVRDLARAPRAFLLPTFDEAFASCPSVPFPRVRDHPLGDQPYRFAESGGGVVLCDGHDAGWWKRTERGRTHVEIRVAPAGGLDAEQRDHVMIAAQRLAAFVDREPLIVMV